MCVCHVRATWAPVTGAGREEVKGKYVGMRTRLVMSPLPSQLFRLWTDLRELHVAAVIL